MAYLDVQVAKPSCGLTSSDCCRLGPEEEIGDIIIKPQSPCREEFGVDGWSTLVYFGGLADVDDVFMTCSSSLK